MEETLGETLEIDGPLGELASGPDDPLVDETVPRDAAARTATLDRIAESLENLRNAFFERAAQDTFRERQIDRLHAEVLEHRSDLLGQLERPVLLGLIRLHDDLGRTVEALRRRDPETLAVETVLTAFAGFQEDLELLLGQYQVERYETPEERFDARRQTAVRTFAATGPEEVGAIAERVRPGFVRGEFILQKERVAVFAATVKPSNLESGAES